MRNSQKNLLTSRTKTVRTMPEETVELHTHLHRTEFSDSIDIGAPSRGGAVKVYFNAGNPDEAKQRIKAAIDLRKYAAQEIEGMNK